MNVAALIVGSVLLLLAPVLFRHRAGLARWGIENRVENVRRTRLGTDEYMQREIDSLKTPGSYKLSEVNVALVSIALAGIGTYAILRGLAVV